MFLSPLVRMAILATRCGSDQSPLRRAAPKCSRCPVAGARSSNAAMADLHPLFASALALSLVFSAYPGAVTTEAFRRGLRGSRPVLFFDLACWAVWPSAWRWSS